jgi:hypothetical protein
VKLKSNGNESMQLVIRYLTWNGMHSYERYERYNKVHFKNFNMYKTIAYLGIPIQSERDSADPIKVHALPTG